MGLIVKIDISIAPINIWFVFTSSIFSCFNPDLQNGSKNTLLNFVHAIRPILTHVRTSSKGYVKLKFWHRTSLKAPKILNFRTKQAYTFILEFVFKYHVFK